MPPSTLERVNRFVQQCRHIFLPVAMSGRQDHHPVLDGQCVQMIQHHMIWFWQQGRLALKGKGLINRYHK